MSCCGPTWSRRVLCPPRLRKDQAHHPSETPQHPLRGAVGSQLAWLSQFLHGQRNPSAASQALGWGKARKHCAGPRGDMRPAGATCSLPHGAAWSALLRSDPSLSQGEGDWVHLTFAFHLREICRVVPAGGFISLLLNFVIRVGASKHCSRAVQGSDDKAAVGFGDCSRESPTLGVSRRFWGASG